MTNCLHAPELAWVSTLSHALLLNLHWLDKTARAGVTPRFVARPGAAGTEKQQNIQHRTSNSQTGASHRSSLPCFPLTPGLSRREREKRSPCGEEPSPLDGSQWVRLLFLLPPGEGQGEGNHNNSDQL